MLGNLLAPSPDALKAQKEKKETDRNAWSAELERLRGLLDDLTDEKKIKGFLPEDIEQCKKFLKGRISQIQAQPTLTEDDLLKLKNNKDGQNFDNLYESLTKRAAFYDEFKGYKTDYSNEIDTLKSKGKPVPAELYTAVKTSDAAIAWLKKSYNETPDVYDGKRQEFIQQFEKAHPQAKLGDVARSIQKSEEERVAKRDEFSISGLITEVLAYVGGYFGLFLIFVTMTLGSSLAVNLNVYKNWAYRLLYAVYGAVFCLVVIPYVIFYRWLWLGKKPKFYSLIPLFPYHWDNRFMQIVLGWISYRPDADIDSLREWEK
jgi:hypothetical protein